MHYLCLLAVICSGRFVMGQSLEDGNVNNLGIPGRKNEQKPHLRETGSLYDAFNPSNYNIDINGKLADAPDIKRPCEAFVSVFSENAADFIRCSVSNASPFRFCEKCVENYTAAIEVYSEIQKVCFHEANRPISGCITCIYELCLATFGIGDKTFKFFVFWLSKCNVFPANFTSLSLLIVMLAI